jgi:hypothetical protein
MTKLGNCTITIEPHVFDAVMFAVKDTTSRPPQLPPQPLYRPIIQYGPPQSMMPQPSPTAATSQVQFLQVQPGTQTGSKPQDTLTKTSNPPNLTGKAPAPNGSPIPHQIAHQGGSTPQSQPATQVATQPTTQPTAQLVSQPIKQPSTQPVNQPLAQNPTQHPAQAQPSSAPPSSAPPAKSTDPVIQMLAERAATDQELKALMRIVADGKASTDELKKFQAHIDELTKLLHTRQASKQAPPPSHPQPPAAVPAANNTRPPPPPLPLPAAPACPAQQPPASNGRTDTLVQPQPQALRSKGPLPTPKPDISAVVFEFVGGSGDRFLFPKYSILEYLPGGQVIASFLIVRKGSSAESKGYDPTLDYYQPVTIRLYTHQGKPLESLAKVVAHPDEVRKYMDDVMTSCMRAEYVLLAMRLPRETEQPVVEEEEATAHDTRDDNQVLWTASANGTATKQKAVKKPLTEGEQYQSFIASVS